MILLSKQTIFIRLKYYNNYPNMSLIVLPFCANIAYGKVNSLLQDKINYDYNLFFHTNINLNIKKYFISYTRYRLMLWYYKNLFFAWRSYYYHKLELIGLGFNIYAKKDRLKMLIGYSHALLYFLPVDVFIKKKHKVFFIFCKNKKNVTKVYYDLLYLQKTTPYKLKGLIKISDKVKKLKIGKKIN